MTDELLQILHEDLTILEAYHVCLLAEISALRARDTERIEATTLEKNSLFDRMEQAERKRRACLNSASLAHVIESSSSQELKKVWKKNPSQTQRMRRSRPKKRDVSQRRA